MASGFGSFGLNDPDLDSLVADLYAVSILSILGDSVFSG